MKNQPIDFINYLKKKNHEVCAHWAGPFTIPRMEGFRSERPGACVLALTRPTWRLGTFAWIKNKPMLWRRGNIFWWLLFLPIWPVYRQPTFTDAKNNWAAHFPRNLLLFYFQFFCWVSTNKTGCCFLGARYFQKLLKIRNIFYKKISMYFMLNFSACWKKVHHMLKNIKWV